MTINETLPHILKGDAPTTFDEMWAGFDPRAEPLDIEILTEREQDGVILKVLRYRIGIFKGHKAMMAAVYGYPKGGSNLPGLVQIHGGGQYADYRAPLTNAKRGYATISIAWAGRINAQGYQVTSNEVKLFWECQTDDPNYKLTTDWGVLDGYHAPSRYSYNAFGTTEPQPWTLDEVQSPRNIGWFLCTLGARRALTFLERQPQVDETRLGVYGHSMGGKLVVLTAAADSRIKAAAPSCGGISDRNKMPIYTSTLADPVNLSKITCPIIFLSPSNDFHGRIDDLPCTVREIKSQHWRITSSPHHNHQDTAEYEVATQLWFDQHLKGCFSWPQTPETLFDFNTKDGVPSFLVMPDTTKPILSVDVFYTLQGQMDKLPDNRENTMNRFWHYAAAKKKGRTWVAKLPLNNTNPSSHEVTMQHSRPLWVYANVHYLLDKPITGAGYYYRIYTATKVVLSSLVHIVSADELEAAGVKTTMKPSIVIETFEKNWQKEWYTYQPDTWARTTHKIYDPRWHAPAFAILTLDVRCKHSNILVVGLDGFAAEVPLKGGTDWQNVKLHPHDFKNAEGNLLKSWSGIKELRLGASETLLSNKEGQKPMTFGGDWKGAAPQFHLLRWIPGGSEM